MEKPVVILTRSEADNRRMIPVFEREGLLAYSFPMIEIQDYPVETKDIPVDRPWVVLLTSVHATSRWLELERKLSNDNQRGYLVVGQKSVDMLRSVNPSDTVLLRRNSIVELLEELEGPRQEVLQTVGGVQRILYPCSLRRREEGVAGLQRLGFDIVEIPLYEPIIPEAQEVELTDVISGHEGPIVFSFFSPSAADNFFSNDGIQPIG